MCFECDLIKKGMCNKVNYNEVLYGDRPFETDSERLTYDNITGDYEDNDDY